MPLSKPDRDALDAQIQAFNAERIYLGLDQAEWDRFVAWRLAVAAEEQAAALWSDDEDEEQGQPRWL